MATAAVDEYRHQPGDNSTWVEAWLFEVVQNDASVAVSIEFLLWPQLGRVSFHASVVQPGHPLISLVDLEIVAPNAPSLEVRAPGLWAEVGIQTPLDHMTVDIEAFAVALDDPDDVFDRPYGIRTALGCELEWETAAEPAPGPTATSYEIPCIVHGELLIDEQTIEIDGWGWRSHRWGNPQPTDRRRIRGRTPAGQWFSEQATDRELGMQAVGVAPVPDPSCDARLRQFFARGDDGTLAWIRRVEGATG